MIDNNNFTDKLKSVLPIILMTLILTGILYLIFSNLHKSKENRKPQPKLNKLRAKKNENFTLNASNLTISDHIDFTTSMLKLFYPLSKVIVLLEEFSKWLKKNPEEKIGLDSFPKVLPDVVVNTYFRQTENNYNPIKTKTNQELLTIALNKIASETIKINAETGHKEGFQQHYRPALIQEFDRWLEDDYPRRKRFDIAIKGSNNLPTRFVVAQIINEFTSTNQIPVSEAKHLRKNVLHYLQFNDTLPQHEQTYYMNPFERLRKIIAKCPDSLFTTKLQHFQKVYADDALGVELMGFIQWLNAQNPSLLAQLNEKSDLRQKNNIVELDALVNEVVNMYPNKTELLEKSMKQFINNLQRI